jgi:hypothetical protein
METKTPKFFALAEQLDAHRTADYTSEFPETPRVGPMTSPADWTRGYCSGQGMTIAALLDHYLEMPKGKERKAAKRFLKAFLQEELAKW